jgi:hypothetical protein
MRFLSELEAERVSTETSKHNELIRGIFEDMLSVAGTFYKADDGRTMRVLGDKSIYSIEKIEVANLSKPYDVVVRNVGSLPQTKTAKLATILDLIKEKPDLLSDEQLVDILELGSVEKLTSIITEALRSAESENEDILNGDAVAEPKPYEEHIIHWKTHIQFMQSRGFKEKSTEEQMEGFEEHIFMTEFLMTEKAKENPAFQAELATLPLFPIFYKAGFTPASKEHQEAMVQGQSNRGDEVTGMIPAANKDQEQFDKENKGDE